jgi:hypothetical protein
MENNPRAQALALSAPNTCKYPSPCLISNDCCLQQSWRDILVAISVGLLVGSISSISSAPFLLSNFAFCFLEKLSFFVFFSGTRSDKHGTFFRCQSCSPRVLTIRFVIESERCSRCLCNHYHRDPRCDHRSCSQQRQQRRGYPSNGDFSIECSRQQVVRRRNHLFET